MNAARKYDILTNQNDEVKLSSIKNDPFNLGSSVKGLARVNHKTALYEHAESLVSTYANYVRNHYELTLDMLPTDEKNELARLYIESTDREINECIYGNDFTINNEFTCALLAMLQDNCKENQEQFAAITQKNILIYYKDSLQDLLSIACDNYLHLVNNEQGYFASRDLEHDEFSWRRP